MNEERKQHKLIWKQRIIEAYTGHLGVYEWMQSHNIPVSTFYKWKRKLEMSGEISHDISPRSKIKIQNNTELWIKRVSCAKSSRLTLRQWAIQEDIDFHTLQSWNECISGASVYEEARIWKNRILEAYRSNITIIDWCKLNEVDIRKFYLWKRILTKNGDIPLDVCTSKNREQHWKSIIVEAFNSKLTIDEWCKQHNICRRAFDDWKRRLLGSGDILLSNLGKLCEYQRKKEHWKQLVLEAYSGKFPIMSWCKQHQVKYSRLLDWKIKLLKNGDILSSDVSFQAPKRRQDYWKPIVLEAYNSDISITDWCEQHNVELTCFSKWTKKLINRGEISVEMIEERKRYKAEHATNNLREPVFCELPIPENTGLTEEGDVHISKGTTFRVGKFTLSVDEGVSEDMLNAALEALNTVMEVFGND